MRGEYVQCGQSMAELKPTAEMRWAQWETAWGHGSVLQQKWVASAKQQDGGMWEEERWRKVPVFVVPKKPEDVE